MSKVAEPTIDRVYRLLKAAGSRGITVKSTGIPRLKDHISRLRNRRGVWIDTSETKDGRTKYVIY